MIINDNTIIQEFYTNKDKMNSNKTRLSWLNNHIEIYNYLLQRYNDSDSIRETIYRIRYKLNKKPCCKYCGKPLKFNRGFTTYCSVKCAEQDNDIILKKKKTTKERHGDENFRNIDKSRETKIQKYGTISYNNYKQHQQTCLKKYGVTSYSKTKEYVNKVKNTCIERYGEDNFVKTKEYNNIMYGHKNEFENKDIAYSYFCTYINNSDFDKWYNGINNERKQKIISAINKFYNSYEYLGYKQVFDNEEIALTYFNTYINNVDFNKWFNGLKQEKSNNNRNQWNNQNKEEIFNKIKQTNIYKYGVDNYAKTDEFKKLITTNKDTIIEKRKQTTLYKYGVEYITQSELVKNKIKQWLNSNEYNGYKNEFKSKEDAYTYFCSYINTNNFDEWYLGRQYSIQLKRNETFKHNHTNTKSMEEDLCYELLKEKYPDIIRQYWSTKYPFNCDFYIPSKDLYIEYNGSQYHHNHPFDKTNEDDIKELHILQEKSTNSLRHKQGKKSQYDSIIYTWTDLDVRKQQYVKQNKLNFVTFWNVDECKKWLENN